VKNNDNSLLLSATRNNARTGQQSSPDGLSVVSRRGGARRGVCALCRVHGGCDRPTSDQVAPSPPTPPPLSRRRGAHHRHCRPIANGVSCLRPIAAAVQCDRSDYHYRKVVVIVCYYYYYYYQVRSETSKTHKLASHSDGPLEELLSVRLL